MKANVLWWLMLLFAQLGLVFLPALVLGAACFVAGAYLDWRRA